MEADRRLVDEKPAIQLDVVLADATFGAAAVSIAAHRLPAHVFPDIDKRAADVAQSLGEIQSRHSSITAQLHDEYLSSGRNLADLQKKNPALKASLNDWSTVNLTEPESTELARWTNGDRGLKVIDSNSLLRQHSASELTSRATSAREYLPFANEMKLSPGMEKLAAPATSYNALVGKYNGQLSELASQEAAFKAIDHKIFVRSAGVAAGSIAVDTDLDYTLLKNRTASPMTMLADLGTPIAAAFLSRKVGPVAFALPTVAHVADKLLWEREV